MVPEEWLRRYTRMARVRRGEGDHVRFRPSQTALLDALLAAQPAVRSTRRSRGRGPTLAPFSGIVRSIRRRRFTGTLREYQREALGWFAFLRRFGFGGCLADDMGLGKTVHGARAARGAARCAGRTSRRPSLAVVPRSLVFNWIEEAGRFAPGADACWTTPATRATLGDRRSYDLVLTTYGTLRRDAARWRTYEFDYVILDEAQAIKNPTTASAKAVRLLRGRHRLALSGTPIENHLGELWSLFEFLNPGLLGHRGGVQGRELGRPRRREPEDLAMLVARALRPFILRRTKEQVAPELPEKTEQTIHCELEATAAEALR